MSDKNTYEAAFDAGQAQSQIRAISDRVTGLVVPEGFSLESLERFAERPSSKRGNATVAEVSSFTRYINLHGAPGATAIFAPMTNDQIVAVLDHHEATAPGWGRHTATLVHRNTLEWLAWVKLHQKGSISQVELAEFLEERITDVAVPTGASLLELVTKFEMKRDVAFSSGVNLQNGLVQLAYAEADATKGTIEVPKTLTLGITPFYGDQLYKVVARLRYRIEAGKLTFSVRLVEPEKVIEQAVNDRLTLISTSTGITPYRGTWAGSQPLA